MSDTPQRKSPEIKKVVKKIEIAPLSREVLEQALKGRTVLNANGKPIEFEISSGNIFADLGRPNADELLLKSSLSIAIIRAIKARKWTQRQAAEVLGLKQPDVSDLQRGRLKGFSIERLFTLLNRLGLNVRVSVEDADTPEAAKTFIAA